MVVFYQPGLVLLSVVVATMGSLTSLAITSGSHNVDDNESWEAGYSVANGGLIIAISVTAMGLLVRDGSGS